MKTIILLFCMGFLFWARAGIPEEWYVIKDPDQRCILAMPDEPEVYRKTIKTNWGNIEIRHCELVIDTCLYKFSIYDYPEKFTNSFSGQEIVSDMMKSISEGHDAPPVKKKIVYNEEMGFELYGQFTLNDVWEYKYRLYGRKKYQSCCMTCINL